MTGAGCIHLSAKAASDATIQPVRKPDVRPRCSQRYPLIASSLISNALPSQNACCHESLSIPGPHIGPAARAAPRRFVPAFGRGTRALAGGSCSAGIAMGAPIRVTVKRRSHDAPAPVCLLYGRWGESFKRGWRSAASLTVGACHAPQPPLTPPFAGMAVGGAVRMVTVHNGSASQRHRQRSTRGQHRAVGLCHRLDGRKLDRRQAR